MCFTLSGSSLSSSLSSTLMLAHVDKQYVQEHMNTDKVNIVPKTKL